MAIVWPTRKREDWRYTDTKPAQRHAYTPATPGANGISPELLATWSLADSAALLVFVNGAYVESLSRPEGRARVIGPGRVDRVTLEGAPLVAHNDASYTACAAIEFGDGTRPEAPIQVLFLHTESDRPTQTHTRVRVKLQKHCELTLVETHVGLGTQPTFETAVTEIDMADGCVVQHVNVQRAGAAANHFHTTVARPSVGRYESHVVSLGAETARSAVHVPFETEGSECLVNGLYAARGTQSLDHYTEIDHRVPHCTSSQTYKGVVADTAVGSFLGRVLMREGAVGSATDQLARVLLLGEGARANAKPQLEIDNDDVRATHGAAIGALDEDALFYLQARGLDRVTARGLMVEGFVREILDRLPVASLAESLAGEVLGTIG